MNVDTRLLRLADAVKASFASLSSRPHRGTRYRAMTTGKARKMIENAYPINRALILAEWNKLAGIAAVSVAMFGCVRPASPATLSAIELFSALNEKPMKIYRLSRSYVRAEIWESNPLTGQRKAVHACRPDTCLTHRQRYEAIAAWLNSHGVMPPPYSLDAALTRRL